ncbi:MAG TPA: glycosyltransferase family 4 protein [Isosphaeraceae bacterium]|nr:glycosyltransferase family 4 protein [Isosphaeraceae bacterium]
MSIRQCGLCPYAAFAVSAIPEGLNMHLALNHFWVDPARGGAETYVCDLCRRLVEDGHEVDLYAYKWNAQALPRQVRVIAVAAPGLTSAGRAWRFAANSAAALGAASYDCTIGFINTWFHDVIIPQAGVRAASIEHNALRFAPGWRRDLYHLGKRANPKHWVYQAIERKQYEPANAMRVIAPSQMVQRHLERYHHLSRERIRVIPNAIDASRLEVADPASARADLGRKLGLAESDLVALFVGHNFWLKGLKPLLNALAWRQQQKPGARPIHLLACGGGRVSPFRAMVDQLGLSGQVHLLGFVPDVRACFWASDFFVLPTYYDPCSLVVFEALACGLPVITTSYNGAGELIHDGREGYVIPTPDARSDLAYVMERMTDDKARKEMSAHATRLGRAQSFEHHYARVLDVLKEVAEAKRSRRHLRGQAGQTDRQPGPHTEAVTPASAGGTREERVRS